MAKYLKSMLVEVLAGEEQRDKFVTVAKRMKLKRIGVSDFIDNIEIEIKLQDVSTPIVPRMPLKVFNENKGAWFSLVDSEGKSPVLAKDLQIIVDVYSKNSSDQSFYLVFDGDEIKGA